MTKEETDEGPSNFYKDIVKDDDLFHLEQRFHKLSSLANEIQRTLHKVEKDLGVWIKHSNDSTSEIRRLIDAADSKSAYIREVKEDLLKTMSEARSITFGKGEFKAVCDLIKVFKEYKNSYSEE